MQNYEMPVLVEVQRASTHSQKYVKTRRKRVDFEFQKAQSKHVGTVPKSCHVSFEAAMIGCGFLRHLRTGQLTSIFAGTMSSVGSGSRLIKLEECAEAMAQKQPGQPVLP